MQNVLEIPSWITFVLNPQAFKSEWAARRGHVSVVHFLVNLLHLLVNPQLIWSGGGKSIFGGYPFLRALFHLFAEQGLKLVFLGQVNTYWLLIRKNIFGERPYWSWWLLLLLALVALVAPGLGRRHRLSYSTHGSCAVLEWTSAQPDSDWVFLIEFWSILYSCCSSLGVDPGTGWLQQGQDLARQDNLGDCNTVGCALDQVQDLRVDWQKIKKHVYTFTSRNNCRSSRRLLCHHSETHGLWTKG